MLPPFCSESFFLIKNMKHKLVMKFKEREKERKKERKWSGKGTRQERNSHLLKRNEAGTKTSLIEKERGRKEIVKLEERSMPWLL